MKNIIFTVLFALVALSLFGQTGLCFKAETAGATFSLKRNNSPADLEIQWSTDGINWSETDKITLSSSQTEKEFSLQNIGDCIYIRNTSVSGGTFSKDDKNTYTFYLSKNHNIAVSGNIMYLLQQDGNRDDVPAYSFYGLFKDNKTLTGVPELPAMTLSEFCYGQMFKSCSSITKTPTLPATTTKIGCYFEMFYGCSSLVEVSDLPALVAEEFCYSGMFGECTSLEIGPNIMAKTLKKGSLKNMFIDCTKLRYLSVNFSDWNTAEKSTENWIKGITPSPSFEFHCPADLPKTTDSNSMPSDWKIVTPPPYLCFTAKQSNTSVTLKRNGSPVNLTIQWSFDGNNWDNHTFTTSGESKSFSLPNVGDVIYLRNAATSNGSFSLDSLNYYQFSIVGMVETSGSIMSLLQKDTETGNVPDWSFCRLFEGCQGIENTPSLPATTIGVGCYYNMFKGCSNLTKAISELPATVLAKSCYESMFENCTSLSTDLPKLPSDRHEEACYRRMFKGCRSIVELPNDYLMGSIPEGKWFTESSSNHSVCVWTHISSCESMFENCTSLKKLPRWQVSYHDYCAKKMFKGCTSLTEVPLEFFYSFGNLGMANGGRFDTTPHIKQPGQSVALTEGPYEGIFENCTGIKEIKAFLSLSNPGYGTFKNAFKGCESLVTINPVFFTKIKRLTTPKIECFYGMFEGCSKLKVAPEMSDSISSLAESCFARMFAGCTSLEATPTWTQANTLATGCYQSMFEGCSALKVAPAALTATKLASSCYESMFEGCTGIIKAPALPAPAMANYCYASMFKGCENLKTTANITLGNSNNLVEGCFMNMYKGCKSIVTPSTIVRGNNTLFNMAAKCYMGMYQDCTSLTEAPQLKATSLADYCYEDMFNGCSSLKLPEGFTLPATILKTSCYEGMFAGTAITASPDLNATTLVSNCYKNMFNGCHNLERITVKFSDWGNGDPALYTADWVAGVKESGTFNCPILLPVIVDPSYMPDWGNLNPMFYLQATAGSAVVKINKTGNPNSTFYYYTNERPSWTLCDGATSISLPSGAKAYFRNSGTDKDFSTSANDYWQFAVTEGKIAAGGKVTSLVDNDCNRTNLPAHAFRNLFKGCTALVDVSNLSLPATSLNVYCYANMFEGCTGIIKAPALPAPAMANYCYASMFKGCENLKTTANITLGNSNNLVEGCFMNMYKGCKSIVTPSTIVRGNNTLFNMAAKCYMGMYQDCTSLTEAPQLKATNLADYCYANMFNGCSSLKLPEGFTLPATILKTSCYEGMFAGTAITASPDLNATTLVSNCYKNMFNGCHNLERITVKFSDWGNGDPALYTADWVAGVKESGTFNCPILLPVIVDPSHMPWAVETKMFYIIANENGASVTLNKQGSPTGTVFYYKEGDAVWTKVTANQTAFELAENQKVYFRNNNGDDNGAFSSSASAYYYFTTDKNISVGGNIMTLLRYDGKRLSTPNHAFRNLFKNCAALGDVSNLSLPATSLGQYCYANMFEGCTGLTDVSSLSSATQSLNNYCYSSMFEGCTNLTTPLNITLDNDKNLSEGCCMYMYKDCEKLSTASVIKHENGTACNLAAKCFMGMYQGCKALTTAPSLPATAMANYCYASMFEGCENLKTTVNITIGNSNNMNEGCFMNMYKDCKSIVTPSIIERSNKTLYNMAAKCFMGMYQNCTSLTEAPQLKATNLADYCYANMFNGCTSLKIAPELPVVTLSKIGCYEEMFSGCSQLTTMTVQFTDWETTLGSHPYTTNWVSGVPESCEFICKGRLPILKGDSYMPCSKENKLFYLEAGNEGAEIAIKKQNSPGGVVYFYKQGEALSTKVSDASTSIHLDPNQKVYFCNEKNGDNNKFSTDGNNYYFVSVSSGKISAGGNIISLVDYDCQRTSTPNHAFRNLFNGCTALMDVTKLNLSVASLGEYCYRNMFTGCTGITTAPVLSSTTLGKCCYESMFSGCTGITTAPELPAKTLAEGCYYKMFDGCTSLTKIPSLEVTTVTGKNSCFGMFMGCTALKTAPELKIATMAEGTYQNMFSGCTSLTEAPELPAKTLATNCYNSMFYGCTSLVKAPVLPATELKSNCYTNMFYGCTSLKYIKVYFTDWSKISNWVADWGKTESEGTFVCSKNLKQEFCSSNGSRIPLGWTVRCFEPTMKFNYATNQLTMDPGESGEAIYWSENPFDVDVDLSTLKLYGTGEQIDCSEWVNAASKLDSVPFYAISIVNSTQGAKPQMKSLVDPYYIYRYAPKYSGYCLVNAGDAKNFTDALTYANHASSQNYQVKVFVPDGEYNLNQNVTVGDWASLIGESVDYTKLTMDKDQDENTLAWKMIGDQAYVQDMEISASGGLLDNGEGNKLKVNLASTTPYRVSGIEQTFPAWSRDADTEQMEAPVVSRNGSTIIVQSPEAPAYLVEIFNGHDYDYSIADSKNFYILSDLKGKEVKVRAANTRGGFGNPCTTVATSATDTKVMTVKLNGYGYASFSYSTQIKVIGASAFTAKYNKVTTDIHLAQINAQDIVPAETGVILFGMPGATVEIYSDNTDGISVADGVNDLKANCISAQTNPNYPFIYGLSANKINRLKEDGKIGLNKAYFDLSSAQSDGNEASSLRMVFGPWEEPEPEPEPEDEVVRLDSISELNTQSNDIYNLQGQKTALDKGLLIKDNQIIMVK